MKAPAIFDRHFTKYYCSHALTTALLLFFLVGSMGGHPTQALAFNQHALLTQHHKMNPSHYATLSDAAWQHRVLIVKVNHPTEGDKFKARLLDNPEAIIERKLLVITLLNQTATAYAGHGFKPSAIQASELTNRLSHAKALLIGLDGGNKATYNQVALTPVFAAIDGMPMRRRELRNP